MSSPFVAAVVQSSPVVFEAKTTLAKVRDLTVDAADRGADDRDTWMSTMQHVALEGRCFVLTACQHLRRCDCPADYAAVYGDAPDTVIMRGGSAIVSPLGQVLVGPAYGEDAILTAEIDPREIARGKYDFDVVGHYARPDVFRLHVNERAAPPVVAD